LSPDIVDYPGQLLVRQLVDNDLKSMK
jgi:hypothetical protein